MALEEDKDIFDALLAPFISSTATIETAPVEPKAPALDLEDEDEVPIEQVVKTSKFSK